MLPNGEAARSMRRASGLSRTGGNEALMELAAAGSAPARLTLADPYALL